MKNNKTRWSYATLTILMLIGAPSAIGALAPTSDTKAMEEIVWTQAITRLDDVDDSNMIVIPAALPVPDSHSRVREDCADGAPANPWLTMVASTWCLTTRIGTGSHIRMNRPDGAFTCTANFVFNDTATGKLYLGSAGHCFLPAGKTSTHGADADYTAAGNTTVYVCVHRCLMGGVSDVLTVWQQLGPVEYARQKNGTAQVGHDFGIVEIPASLYWRVNNSMPVWGGPTTTGNPFQAQLCQYGYGVVFGEVFPTMGRTGVGVSITAASWHAVLPAAFGDSGSPVVTCTTSATGVQGVGAAGMLTHLSNGLTAGTRLERAIKYVKDDKGWDIEIQYAP